MGEFIITILKFIGYAIAGKYYFLWIIAILIMLAFFAWFFKILSKASTPPPNAPSQSGQASQSGPSSQQITPSLPLSSPQPRPLPPPPAFQQPLPVSSSSGPS